MIGSVEVKFIFLLGYLMAVVSLSLRQTLASLFQEKTIRVSPSASGGLNTKRQAARVKLGGP
jgi:hypothetical protein